LFEHKLKDHTMEDFIPSRSSIPTQEKTNNFRESKTDITPWEQFQHQIEKL